ncbi:LOB domain-containing protein 29-like [Pyrus ussuriensis x Pyrus communis]|uniref:LOB domain-containing protein 29-like n=1 Tax=Pyrus ussuriensis x Pyrus communis TaxID=2448454 RepID=A0A5N5FGK8_9ROSA|nr:LOB domain-containing protein 29-like [Pyrus ussuriensis x Pyrus communis]
MTGSGSPCGACKFLRRKCIRGCVFAPYFCHEQGATHFATIHKVFGASNVSKLLAQLSASDRCRAALTISYEAQARVQDPIYGCVSHIFSLQQQIISLEAQLASVKEQAAKGYSSNNFQGWLQSENSNTLMPQSVINESMTPVYSGNKNPHSFGANENFMIPEVLNDMYGSYGDNMSWSFDQDHD